MQKIRNLFKHEEGFTLIELLVVIAVLGILAAIAIPRLGGVTDQARMSEATSAMGSFKTSLEMYYSETGNYPTNSEFADAMGRFIDNFDADNDKFTGGEGRTWTVTYSNDDNNPTESFDVVMEADNFDYVVTMSHTTSGYEEVEAVVSN